LLKDFSLRGKTNRSAIRVDKDGLWYFQGKEIIRKEILSLFYASLHRDDDGYYLEISGERQYLEVEDTVFLVRGAELVRQNEEVFLIKLNDGTEEQLDLTTFRIAEGNIPYCLGKGGKVSCQVFAPPLLPGGPTRPS